LPTFVHNPDDVQRIRASTNHSHIFVVLNRLVTFLPLATLLDTPLGHFFNIIFYDVLSNIAVEELTYPGRGL
jgi:hypothetical protein